MPSWQWVDLDNAIKHRVADVPAGMLPAAPGVYAWYRAGSAAVRRAGNIATGPTVEEPHLGFGTTAAFNRCEITLTADQLARVHRWLRACELAWLVRDSAADAISLEAQPRKKSLPHLNQR